MGGHDCPHCGSNATVSGSPDTFVNHLKSHRLGDTVTEFCGSGTSVTASPNVIVN